MSSLHTLITWLYLVFQKTQSGVPNTWIKTSGPNGEDMWTSTSWFRATNATSYGTIKVGQVMVMEFDFRFRTRVNTPTPGDKENYFRIGHAGAEGGCDEGTRYPSMWLTGGTTEDIGLLDISVTSGSQCDVSHVLTGYGNITRSDIWSHCVITIDWSTITFNITGGGKRNYSESWQRNEITKKEDLGVEVPIWFGSDRPRGYIGYNIGTPQFKEIRITSSVFTYAPTAAPTAPPTTAVPSTITTAPTPTKYPSAAPSDDPTAAASKNPTTHPSEAVSQPAFVYDGEGDVNITGQSNWTLKYPLGVLCEHPSWTKTLTVDIQTVTPNQADLVMAFGTRTRYLCLVIPYDSKGVVVRHNDGTKTGAGALIAPKPGMPLLIADTTLENQFFMEHNDTNGSGMNEGISDPNNWRYSLMPNRNSTLWHAIAERNTNITENVSPLILTVWSDRATDQTQITVQKNGDNASVSYSSTWGFREEAFFFLGLDYASTQPERFIVHSIRSNDTCTEATIPTAPTTLAPSATPTASTDVPTKYPSFNPTVSPSDAPTEFTIHPTKYPSFNPTVSPSDSPTELTLRPTETPSKTPTVSPTKSPIPTKMPTVVPTKSPTKIPTEFPSETPTTDAPTMTLSPTEVPTEFEEEVTAPKSTLGELETTVILANDQRFISTEDGDYSEVTSKNKATPLEYWDKVKNNVMVWVVFAVVVFVCCVVIPMAVYFGLKKWRRRQFLIDHFGAPESEESAWLIN